MRSDRNRYFVMRHGESQANTRNIIVSHPREGMAGFGLTEAGRTQAEASVREAKQVGLLDAETIIFSSDFLRTMETADIAAEILDAQKPISSPQLRERSFGIWNGTHTNNYQKVWDDDSRGTIQENSGVESVSDVRDRAVFFVQELEEKYHDKNILLVSHGDTLQILQTAFEDTMVSHHRDLPSIRTAEIRRLG